MATKRKVRYDINKVTGTTAAFDITSKTAQLICAFPGKNGERKARAYVGIYLEGATIPTIEAGQTARIGGYAMEALGLHLKGLIPKASC